MTARNCWLIATLLCVAAGPVAAQEPYQTLWQRGAYHEALQALEAQLEQMSYRPRMLREDEAELLFSVGRVDEAIAVLEDVVSSYMAPMVTVRLAEMYKYRGRLRHYEVAVQIAGRQVDMVRSDRQDAADRVAAGRVMELKGDDPRTILRYYAQLGDEAPALLAAGHLALRKRAFDVAARNYGRVLALDAENQAALAGLAQCYYQSGDPRVNETLEKLLAINPHHPEAHLLQVEALLDLGQAAAAIDTVQAMLAINPNQLDALALLSAGRFLQDDSTGLAAAQNRALAFNAHDSRVYRVAGRVAARHYRFEESEAFQKQALAVDSNDTEARLLLAFDRLRLGEDGAARKDLERVFAEDPFSVRAYNLLQAADAIDSFRTVDRGIFRLELPGPEAEVMADDMLALLTDEAARYQATYRIALQTPVTVQVFNDHDVFMVRSVGLPGNEGHLGICFGRLVTMDSPRARPPGTVNWQEVLWHEFVHVITLQKTRNRMPRWLSEGISVFEETNRDPAWGQKLDPHFKAVVDEAGAPGMTDLEALFTSPSSPVQLLFGYFAAGEFVHWYVGAFGMPALVTALDRIGEGAPATQALAEAGGETTADLDAHFRAQMAARCAPLAQVRAGSAFHRALDEGVQAVAVGDTAKAQAAYDEAFGLYPDYTGADAPLRRLVALCAPGDKAGLRDALNRLVRWDPAAFDACLQLGAVQKDLGDLAGAQWALDRAFAINPFHTGLLAQRADVETAQGDFDGAVRDLRRLLRLNPTDRANARLQLARVLLKQGSRDAAKAEVLSLLETMPHFWDAQELLLEIVEKP